MKAEWRTGQAERGLSRCEEAATARGALCVAGRPSVPLGRADAALRPNPAGARRSQVQSLSPRSEKALHFAGISSFRASRSTPRGTQRGTNTSLSFLNVGWDESRCTRPVAGKLDAPPPITASPGGVDGTRQPWGWPRTVCQDCQVMRRITSVMARPMSGSAMSAPIATAAAEAITARLT